MAYDNLHNITGKKQTLEQQDLQFAGVLKTGYDLTYAYNAGKPQQISTIADTSYRTEGAIVKQGKTQSYSYDANGNLLGVNTTQPAADGSLRSTNNRRLLWDEENRLLAVSDNGYVSNYWYDASGERTLKMSGEGEGVLVNGILSGGRTGTSKYTAYVNPYLVVSSGGQMSKHFYIGTQRVVSQLCSSGAMADATKNPRTVARAAASTVDYNTKYTALISKVKTRFDSLGVAYSGKDNAGVGFWTYTPTVNETDQYYYHPDHLGSSSLITNLGGDLVQHIEYVPFGEVFVEERTSTWGTPYKFNAKELDEETGLYYYSARYMDPRTSVWFSVDPLSEKKPWMSSYVYCSNNPLCRIDPDGMDDYGLDVNTAKLTLVKQTNDEFDNVYTGTFDEKGNFSENYNDRKNYNVITLSKGTLNSTSSNDDLSKSGFVTNGNNQRDGVALMDFISTYSGKETSGIGFRTSGSKSELLVGAWDKNEDNHAKPPILGNRGSKMFSIHTHHNGKDQSKNYGNGVASYADFQSKGSEPHYILSQKHGLTQYFPAAGRGVDEAECIKFTEVPLKQTVPVSLRGFVRY